MCGIIGAVSERNIIPILIEGLRRMEYRGYDSAGLVVIDHHGHLERLRVVGKVAALEAELQKKPVAGTVGLAHTRWATHGKPLLHNAHPHISQDSIAVVHNGIIENYTTFQTLLLEQGYQFESETDTEVVAHLVSYTLQKESNLLAAWRKIRSSSQEPLKGAYALGLLHSREPTTLLAAREGSPLVIGVGFREYFLASDPIALLPVTQRFIFLEEGDTAILTLDGVLIEDRQGKEVSRPVQSISYTEGATSKGEYRHYMLKEMMEQPQAVADTLQGRVYHGQFQEETFALEARNRLAEVEQVHIIACGTSYHAGLIARYWFEANAIPCMVEIASEYRYREVVVLPKTLFVTISQSGETADTLAAQRKAKGLPYLATLAICNVPQSTLVREADFSLLTRAGLEIGVASTKAFLTQVIALRILIISILFYGQKIAPDLLEQWSMELFQLPGEIQKILEQHTLVQSMARDFADQGNTLFVGRGIYYPIAMEGALKLKEISYIHAEACAAGELKHGPLALVDDEMPVIALLGDDSLRDKMLATLQEIRARDGLLFIIADKDIPIEANFERILKIAPPKSTLAPILFVIPLQLLAYYVAVFKGTDVDQPRNLAKSVTVE